LGADGLKLGEDHVESFDGLFGVADSGGIGSGISLAVLLDKLEVLVDDVHLVLEDGDGGLEVGDLGSEGADFFDGRGNVRDGGVDSPMEIFDCLLTLGLSFSL